MNPGDVVQLKSGGPIMTIESLTNDTQPMYVCIWFDKNDCLQSHHLPGIVIQKFNEGLKKK